MKATIAVAFFNYNNINTFISYKISENLFMIKQIFESAYQPVLLKATGKLHKVKMTG